MVTTHVNLEKSPLEKCDFKLLNHVHVIIKVIEKEIIKSTNMIILCLTVALASLPYLAAGEGECLVESNLCSFPFQVEDESHYGCVQDEDGDPESDRYYCKSQLGDKYVTGICNGGCFDEDNFPYEFNSSFASAMSFFCKTSASPCQFPFIWNGKEYNSCTQDGDVPFAWCALQVDEDRNLYKNRWAKCDMSTCSQTEPVVEMPEPKQIQVHFSEYSGEILMEQIAPDEALQFSGHLEGLPDGKLELALVPSACDQPHNIDLITSIQSLAATSDIKTEIWTKSLYPEENNHINGHSLIIKEENEAVPLMDDEGGIQMGKILACTPIQVQATSALSLTYIIIIILAALVIVLILTLVIIVCCCCKRKRQEKSHYKEACSIDEEEPMTNGNGKIPLYDELSIPFIDASLPPTPKMGRSTDQLAILLGKGSRTSLSREEA